MYPLDLKKAIHLLLRIIMVAPETIESTTTNTIKPTII